MTKRYYILRLNQGQIYAHKLGREFGKRVDAEEWVDRYGTKFDYIGERWR